MGKEESTSQVVSCCCFDTTFGKKAVRLNRFQAVMGCVTTLALIVLSVVTMRIHAAVHFDAAIIFFITSSLQFWTNFKLQCTITDTTVWGQISGSSIAPRSLGVKRWIIRSTLVLCAAMLIIFICLVVAGATSFSKRWFAPLCQYIAILVLGASYATYAKTSQSRTKRTVTRMLRLQGPIAIRKCRNRHCRRCRRWLPSVLSTLAWLTVNRQRTNLRTEK